MEIEKVFTSDMGRESERKASSALESVLSLSEYKKIVFL